LQAVENRQLQELTSIRLGRRGSGVQIAPPRPNLLLIPKELFDWRSIAFAIPLPLLCQNCAKTRLGLAFDCAKTLAAFIGLAVQFRQRLSLHLQLHLRVLLEYLRIALPEQRKRPVDAHRPVDTVLT
jgi:hypothetical protein